MGSPGDAKIATEPPAHLGELPDQSKSKRLISTPGGAQNIAWSNAKLPCSHPSGGVGGAGCSGEGSGVGVGVGVGVAVVGLGEGRVGGSSRAHPVSAVSALSESNSAAMDSPLMVPRVAVCCLSGKICSAGPGWPRAAWGGPGWPGAAGEPVPCKRAPSRRYLRGCSAGKGCLARRGTGWGRAQTQKTPATRMFPFGLAGVFLWR